MHNLFTSSPSASPMYLTDLLYTLSSPLLLLPIHKPHAMKKARIILSTIILTAIISTALSSFVNRRFTSVPFYTLVNYYLTYSTVYYDPTPFIGPHPFLYVTNIGTPATYAVYVSTPVPGQAITLTRLGGTETITIPVWTGPSYLTATTFAF